MLKKKKPEDDSNKPWVSNYPPLQEWLDKHEARCMWQVPMQCEHVRTDYDYPSAYVECWIVGKGIIILVVHGDKHGWELYSALGTNKIDETFEDAEKRLGIEVK